MFRVKIPDLHEGALPEVPAMFPTFLAAKGHFRNLCRGRPSRGVFCCPTVVAGQFAHPRDEQFAHPRDERILYDFCRRCYILPRRGIVKTMVEKKCAETSELLRNIRNMDVDTRFGGLKP